MLTSHKSMTGNECDGACWYCPYSVRPARDYRDPWASYQYHDRTRSRHVTLFKVDHRLPPTSSQTRQRSLVLASQEERSSHRHVPSRIGRGLGAVAALLSLGS